MTITATILEDSLQGSGKHNVTCRYDDDIDASQTRLLQRVPPGDTAFVQGWVDDFAVTFNEQKRKLELKGNFDVVRNGGHSEDDVSLLYNTTAQWEEYLFKGMSNLRWGDAVADFAHVFTESKANQRAVAATGLSNPQVVGWSGDAQPVEISRTNYVADHTSDPAFTFEGFPTE